MADTAERFKRDTADHQMTVLHDDGLYRHVRFRQPRNEIYWFDLITVPGALIFQGDGDSFTFRRTEDMFDFFRTSAWMGEPNVRYWEEKLTSDSRVMRYDQELLRKFVDEVAAEATKENPKLTRLAQDVRRHVTDELVGDESLDRAVVEDFKHWINEDDEYAVPHKQHDWGFPEIWEMSFRDYDWWFLWACHAIVWGIGCYDKKATPGPRIVDVHLPEPDGAVP
jgi:hypothetical protein